MRLAHGFTGVTPVDPAFGDGVTRSPVISGGGPAADTALRACPFDTSLFDGEKVKAAVKAGTRP